MLDTVSYFNYKANIFYYFGKLGYDLSKYLTIGSCKADEIRREIKLLQALFDIINCYSYPVNIILTGFTTLDSNIMQFLPNTFSPLKLKSLVGLNISGTSLQDDTKIIGVSQVYCNGYDDIDLIYIDKPAIANSNINFTIHNHIENCLSDEDFLKVVKMINKILDVNYCVPINKDYV